MAVAGYNVYVEGVLVATVPSTTASIRGLDPGLYHAQVSAFDGSGNQSAESSAVAFTVPTPETVGDSFPGIPITGAQGEIGIDTTGATTQGSEPWDDARTVWASWTAPATMRVVFDTLLSQLRDSLATVAGGITSLEGYWRLDEGGYVAVDDAGMNRHGVYVNGHQETTGSREVDQTAALLDGATQRIEIPDAAGFSIGPTGMTILVIVRVDQTTPAHTGADGFVPIVEKAGEWFVGYESLSASGLPGGFCASVPRGDPPASFADLDYITAPTFVMLVVTFDPTGSGGGVTLYRSNAPRSFRAYTTPPTRPPSPSPVMIGGGDGFLQGAVDDVAIWSRVLTTDEITSLYTEFAGIQSPPAYYGIAASGTTTETGDMILTYAQAVPAGRTLELWVASEYQAGANTIFDTGFNDYTRVLRSRNDGQRLGKLVAYRCDVSTDISPGDTLTIRPATPVGIRAAAVLHFDLLGGIDSTALQSGSTQQPPAAPAIHPTGRDDRCVAGLVSLGPPGDAYTEDPAFTTQVRIGTTSFDAGVPVTRSRYVLVDAQHNPAGFSSIVLTNTGAPVLAGASLHVHIAHTYTAAGPSAIADSAGNTWAVPTGGSQADAAHTMRETWYISHLTHDWPTGGTITITGTSALTDYAVIVEAMTGDAAATQLTSSTNIGSSASGAPLDPDSLAGLCVGTLSWEGPVGDVIALPPDWGEAARAGAAGVALSLLLANPLRRGSHEVVFNPDLDTAPRTWVSVSGYLPPAATTGGPLTPHESNVTLNLSLLNGIPLGADVPFQPLLDATPDQQRDWISIVIASLHP